MTARVRVMVADDEPLARDGLRMLLAADPEVELVAECASGEQTVDQVRALKPDVLLLDVQMPAMDGFEVVAALGKELPPAVVFITAYDRYALRAFEVHALDYLLKPFDDERFHDALRRAKNHLRLSRFSDLSERLMSLLGTTPETGDRLPKAPEEASFATRLAIKDVGRVVFLSVDEIDWIEAADYYVEIHAGAKCYLHRETMQSLEARLDPARFVRIHRSAIVNQHRIKELRSHGRRELTVILSGGAELKVARSHREKLARLSGR